MIGLLMWTACTPEAPVPDDEPALEPLPWTFEPPARADTIDLDAVGTALNQAAREVLAYDARDVVDAYLDRVATSATASCPEVTLAADGSRYWVSGCATDDGASFGGFLFHTPLLDSSNGQFLFSGDTLTGNARVTDPAGMAIDIQGAAAFMFGTALDGSTELVISSVNGGFALDDAPSGWLADGPQSVEVQLVGFRLLTIPGAAVQATGAVVTSVSGDTYAVNFDVTTMATDALSSCDIEPGGVIEVRDVTGQWIDVVFDGPTLDETPGDATACDGCGVAILDGTEIGTVCADFTPWLGWEALP